jgi:hypothetical protein
MLYCIALLSGKGQGRIKQKKTIDKIIWLLLVIRVSAILFPSYE